jgi:probable RNA-binding protein EIF1AD
MAGLGRRTHYRKHLTDSVLYDLPEPELGERIAKVCSTRGSNQFDLLLGRNIESRDPPEIVLAILPTKFRKLIWLKRNDFVIVQTVNANNPSIPLDSSTSTEISDNNTDRYEIRNDSNVRVSEENSSSLSCGIRFMITRILYKNQIKHLASKGMWPTHPDFQWLRNDKESVALPAEKEEIGESQPTPALNASDVVHGNHKGHHGHEQKLEESEDDCRHEEYADYNGEYDDLLFVNTNRLRCTTVQDSDSSSDGDDGLFSGFT